jgi:hypothetical protein
MYGGLLPPENPLASLWWGLEYHWSPVPLMTLCACAFGAIWFSQIWPERRGTVSWRDLHWYELAAAVIAALVFSRFLLALLPEGSYPFEGRIGIRYAFGMGWTLSQVFDFPIGFGAVLPILLRGLLALSLGAGLAAWLTSRRRLQMTAHPETPPRKMEELVQSVLESNAFVRAVLTASPVGEEDLNAGLDGVSRMLGSIHFRREKAEKSAQRFLWLTLFLGAIFLVVVIWFGYVLVNDEATGLGNAAANTRRTSERIEKSLQQLGPTDSPASEYRAHSQSLLDQAAQLAQVGALKEDDKKALDEAVKTATEGRKRGDYPQSLDAFKKIQAISQRVKWDGAEKYNSTLSRFQESGRGIDLAIAELQTATPRLSDSLDELNKRLATPENRIPDLLKRIAIGLIVVSFMIAILRYTSRLYQRQMDQAIAAGQDELFVRRFLVAYKGSEGYADLRKAVLQNFVKGLATLVETEAKEKEISNKEALALVNEVLKVVSKRVE